jgi:hypothetical protein
MPDRHMSGDARAHLNMKKDVYCTDETNHYCGSIDWHTVIEHWISPKTFLFDEEREYWVNYRVGTLEQLKELGFSIINEGIKRWISSPSVWENWGFTEVLNLSNSFVQTFYDGPNWCENPILVQADDGSPEIWLIDGTLRRHVPSQQIIESWNLDLETIETWTAAELDEFPIGPDLRDHPVIVQDESLNKYIIDSEL